MAQGVQHDQKLLQLFPRLALQFLDKHRAGHLVLQALERQLIRQLPHAAGGDVLLKPRVGGNACSKQRPGDWVSDGQQQAKHTGGLLRERQTDDCTCKFKKGMFVECFAMLSVVG